MSSESNLSLNPATWLSSSSAILGLLSALFLLIGVVYTFGLLLPIGESLLTYVSLADYVNAAASISLTLLLMIGVAMLVATIVFGFGYTIGMWIARVVLFLPALVRQRQSTDSPELGLIKRVTEDADSHSRKFASALSDRLQEHVAPIGAYLLLGLANVLLHLLTRFIVPDAAVGAYESSYLFFWIVLIICVTSLFALAAERIESLMWNKLARFVAGGVLVILIAFQMGTLESASMYNYLVGTVNERNTVNEDETVHIIRAIDQGLLVAKKIPPNPDEPYTLGIIELRTWSSIERTGMIIQRRLTDPD